MSLLIESPPAYSSPDSSPSSSIDQTGNYSFLEKKQTNSVDTVDLSPPLEERIDAMRKRCLDWEFTPDFPTELHHLLKTTVYHPDRLHSFYSLCEIFFSFKTYQLLERGKLPKQWLVRLSDQLIEDLEKKLGNGTHEDVDVTVKMMQCILTRARNEPKKVKNLKKIEEIFRQTIQIQSDALNFQKKIEELEAYFEETLSRAESCREKKEQLQQIESLITLTPITTKQKEDKEKLCNKIGLIRARPSTSKKWWKRICCLS